MILLQIDEWFSKGLAGLDQAPGSVGFEGIVIKPRLVGDLTHVAGSYETPHGRVASEWTRDAGRRAPDVTVPAGTNAKVYVPAGARARTSSASAGPRCRSAASPATRSSTSTPGQVTFRRGTSVPGDVGGTVPATLSLTVGSATFGAFTPGVGRDYTATDERERHQHRGRRGAERLRPRPPAQRRVRSCRSRCRWTIAPNAWSGAGVERDLGDHVPPADRRQRRAADRHLQQTLTFTLSTTSP